MCLSAAPATSQIISLADGWGALGQSSDPEPGVYVSAGLLGPE